MTGKGKRDFKNGLLFVAPWILGLILFTVIPACMSLFYSLNDYSVLTEPIFIGTANYNDLITDELFLKSISNTIIFGVIALPLSTFFAIFLALLLDSLTKYQGIFRTLFFLPSLVPLVALALLWQFMFSGDIGILNVILEVIFDVTGLALFGFEKAPNWLESTFWAKQALIITILWSVGQPMVIYLAGLQEIPRSFYEAAIVDGANFWQQTLYISVPMLSPVIYFNVIIGTIGILQVFAVPYIMMGPQGDPLRSTMFYLMYLFDQAFRKFNMGYACAMAWILFVVIATLTYLAHKSTIKYVYYGGN